MSSFIKISETVVTSDVSSVTITGIDSGNNYVIIATNVTPSVDGNEIRMRFTASGTAQSTSNYDWAGKFLRGSAAFINDYDSNQSNTRALNNLGTAAGESGNSVIYLYNAFGGSSFTYATIDNVSHNQSEGRGYQSGTVYTVAESHDGVYFHNHQGGSISSGTFTLYQIEQ